jgi:hypothetical protein
MSSKVDAHWIVVRVGGGWMAVLDKRAAERQTFYSPD